MPPPVVAELLNRLKVFYSKSFKAKKKAESGQSATFWVFGLTEKQVVCLFDWLSAIISGPFSSFYRRMSLSAWGLNLARKPLG